MREERGRRRFLTQEGRRFSLQKRSDKYLKKKKKIYEKECVKSEPLDHSNISIVVVTSRLKSTRNKPS